MPGTAMPASADTGLIPDLSEECFK